MTRIWIEMGMHIARGITLAVAYALQASMHSQKMFYDD